jgi:hypothetical protein
MFDQIKQALAQAIADLQAEVGVLFTLKAKILRVADAVKRENLLAEQSRLEGLVAGTLSKVSTLQAQIPSTVSVAMLKDIKKYQGLVTQGYAMAKEAVAMRQAILAHTARVQGTPIQAAKVGTGVAGVKVPAMLALAAIAAAGIAGYQIGRAK